MYKTRVTGPIRVWGDSLAGTNQISGVAGANQGHSLNTPQLSPGGVWPSAITGVMCHCITLFFVLMAAQELW